MQQFCLLLPGPAPCFSLACTHTPPLLPQVMGSPPASAASVISLVFADEDEVTARDLNL